MSQYGGDVYHDVIIRTLLYCVFTIESVPQIAILGTSFRSFNPYSSLNPYIMKWTKWSVDYLEKYKI
jgi:hypothetical protein